MVDQRIKMHESVLEDFSDTLDDQEIGYLSEYVFVWQILTDLVYKVMHLLHLGGLQFFLDQYSMKYIRFLTVLKKHEEGQAV